METLAFFEQIKRSFRYLADECGFVVAKEETLPYFTNAQVIFQCSRAAASPWSETRVTYTSM